MTKQIDACKRKPKYSHRSEALRVKRDHQARTRKILRIYLCPFCHNYHLTSRKTPIRNSNDGNYQ